MAKILVVDDELQILELLSIVLTRAGYEVQTAENPQNALEMCSLPASFDLVLSDVDMPEMNGHELTRWIVAHNPGCRVILMSAFDSECGACPYPAGCELVRKPFDPKEVVSCVAAALAQPPKLSKESSQAGDAGLQIGSRFLRQLLEAHDAIERASDQLRRLDLLASDAEIGNQVALLQAQAQRVQSAARKVYQIALQRYKDFQEGRLASGNTPHA